MRAARSWRLPGRLMPQRRRAELRMLLVSLQRKGAVAELAALSRWAYGRIRGQALAQLYMTVLQSEQTRNAS
jgi:hypothetical protein